MGRASPVALMTPLSRLVCRHFQHTMGITWAVLWAVLMFLHMVSECTRGEWAQGGCLPYVLWHAPQQAATCLPFAMVLGGVWGVHLWIAQGEWVAFQNMGVSPARLWRATGPLCALWMASAWILSNMLVPYGLEQAAWIQARTWEHAAALHGIWLRDGDTWMHIARITPQGRVQRVQRFTFAQHRLTMLEYSPEAEVTQPHVRPLARSTWPPDAPATRWTVPASLGPLLKSHPEWMSSRALRAYAIYQDRHAPGTSHVIWTWYWTQCLHPLWCVLYMGTSLMALAQPMRRGTRRMGWHVARGILCILCFRGLTVPASAWGAPWLWLGCGGLAIGWVIHRQLTAGSSARYSAA